MVHHHPPSDKTLALLLLDRTYIVLFYPIHSVEIKVVYPRGADQSKLSISGMGRGVGGGSESRVDSYLSACLRVDVSESKQPSHPACDNSTNVIPQTNLGDTTIKTA